MAAFEDQDLLPGLREIRGGHEAVVASPDHDGVVALRHPLLFFAFFFFAFLGGPSRRRRLSERLSAHGRRC
jgi:hypothetical protein